MIIGFTGTRQGMTDDQLDTLYAWFMFCKDQIDEAHFGLCRGSDAQFYHLLLAVKPSVVIVGHPCNLVDQQVNLPCDYMRPTKDPLVRNHDMVDEVESMLATPATMRNVLRSGTYSCLRYAANKNRDLNIILPNGRMSSEIEYE